MKALLLTVLLLAPVVQAAPVLPNVDAADTRMVDWPQRKAAVREMMDAYFERFRGDRTWNEKDKAQLQKILGQIWDLLNDVEAKSLANVRFIEKAVDEKVAAGKMDKATGEDLKARAGMIYMLRMYYVYGNMWPRIMDEGFQKKDMGTTPAEMFGANVAIQITQEEYDQVKARYDFDPEKYGLPKPPEIKAEKKP